MDIRLIEHEVSFEDYVAPIESITDAQIVFRYVSATYSVTGIVDRVTGKTSIEKLYDGEMGKVLTMLICRPSTRLFSFLNSLALLLILSSCRPPSPKQTLAQARRKRIAA